MIDWKLVAAKSIGTRIRERREELGLSQSEVAIRIDSYRPLVSRIEHGHHLVNLETLIRYAMALDVTVAHLVGGLDFSAEIRP